MYHYTKNEPGEVQRFGNFNIGKKIDKLLQFNLRFKRSDFKSKDDEKLLCTSAKLKKNKHFFMSFVNY